jgi:hypothetical protein
MTVGLELLITVAMLALATGAVVDVWLNGSIFATWRARVETWENVFSELFGCSLCLNYQAAIWLTLGLWALPMVIPGWAASVLRGVLVMLAVGRLAWLIDRACIVTEHGYDRGGPDLGSHDSEEDP